MRQNNNELAFDVVTWQVTVAGPVPATAHSPSRKLGNSDASNGGQAQ